MPSLGADMSAGTLVKWLVSKGDAIKQGDIIAEVETDKGTIEVEAFHTGTVKELLTEEGTKVPVGTPLAVIDESEAPATETETESETVSETKTETAAVTAQVEPETATSVSAASATAHLEAPPAAPSARRKAHELGVSLRRVSGTGEHGRITRTDIERVAASRRDRVRVSPFAVRRAAELGVSISGIEGTGPGGAIQAADVERAADQERQSAPQTKAEAMQRAIAAAMTRANDEIPHYYVSQTIDMGKALEYVGTHNATQSLEERLVPGVLLMRAVSRALERHGELNAVWRGGEPQTSDGIHVGVAITIRGGGLVAPALRHTNDGSLGELMKRLSDLVERARAGSIRSSELTSATITVTSLGERGVESVLPIIFPPQVAIVGFGAIAERPWVVDGTVVVRPVVHATLGADHRVSNGHGGARFLARVDRLLQTPEKL